MNQKAKNTLQNLNQAFLRLEEGLQQKTLSYLEKAGIIKSFEFVYELTWISLKFLLEQEGHATQTARQVFQTAYKQSLIEDENKWLEMIKDRNLTVHTYDEEFATITENKIRNIYYPLFKKTINMLNEKLSE